MKEGNNKLKLSLPPISNDKTQILILGTLPSEISLRVKQYYANPRNQFWRIISCITNRSTVPETYEKKINLLKSNQIGLWDVLFQAKRTGSLDKHFERKA